MRAVLTAYGLETRIMNHIYYDDKYFQINLNYGDNDSKISYMIEFSADDIIKFTNLSLGLNFAVWQQPQLLDSDSKVISPNKFQSKIGGQLFLTSKFNISKSLDIVAGMGYKSFGFLAGSPLKDGFLFRAGINVTM